MNITFLCLGSRGDVQPYIALGQGLQRSGHHVRIATHQIFQPLVTHYGLEFRLVEGNPQELLQGDAAKQVLKSGGNIIKMARKFREAGAPILRQMLDSSLTALQGSDALIYGILGFSAYHLAQLWNIPAIAMPLQPITRTTRYQATGFPSLPYLPGYNRLSWLIAEEIFIHMIADPVSKWRDSTLPLPPLSSRAQYQQMLQLRHPIIYGISPTVLPRPKDYPPFHRLAGYWFLEEAEGWQPPAGLQAFLTQGPKPVYIGFGSMDAGESQQTTASVLAALKNTGQRAVLLRGWGGIHAEDLPSTAYLIDSVPHSWLFPQMAAIVHHGGAGTTAAAFRAGVPQLLLPHFADQPLWAQRVSALKAGPPPLYMNNLTPQKLTAALLQTTTNPAYQQNARALGQLIRQEDGVTTAVSWINTILADHYGKQHT